jgi:predicted hydrocarbon binding protein
MRFFLKGDFFDFGGFLMLNSFFDKFIFTNGLKYKHNNFFLLNMPFVIVPSDLLVALSAKQDKNIDLELYYSVKEYTLKKLVKEFNIDFGLEGEKGLKFVEDFFSASGWGAIKRIDLDTQKKRAIVVVSNSPIAVALNGKAKHAVDHFLRGILAGIFSDFFKTSVECVETECGALNDKSCKFVLKKLEGFNFDKAETRRQLRVE